MTVAETAEDRRKAYEQEWGQYVATTGIDVYGVHAYNAGDPVPASAVGQSVPEELVRKVGGKGGAQPYADSTTVNSVEPPQVVDAPPTTTA